MEDLRDSALRIIRGTLLEFYQDSALNTKAIIVHVIHPETGMQVSMLLKMVEEDESLKTSV